MDSLPLQMLNNNYGSYSTMQSVHPVEMRTGEVRFHWGLYECGLASQRPGRWPSARKIAHPWLYYSSLKIVESRKHRLQFRPPCQRIIRSKVPACTVSWMLHWQEQKRFDARVFPWKWEYAWWKSITNTMFSIIHEVSVSRSCSWNDPSKGRKGSN